MPSWEDDNTGLRHNLSAVPVNYMNSFGISFADISSNDVEKALDFLDLAMAEEESLDSFDHRDPNVELPCWEEILAYDSPPQSFVPVPVSEIFPMKFSDVVRLPPRKPCESRMNPENMIVGDEQLDAKARSFHEKTIPGKEPVSGCGASLLIDTMHNLSKFLLNHCSNGTCVLSEQDVSSLEEVILNLDKCISTNIGQELHSDLRLGINMGCLQGINMGCLQVGAIGAPSQMPQEKGKQSDEKNQSSSAVVFVESGSNTEVKMDKKAQNAPCLACFRNMNIEMEKSLSDNETDASDDDEKSSIIGSDEKSVHKLATEANDSPISGQSPQDMLANDAEERLDSKDFHLCSEHDGTTESPDMTSDEDDWEHVSMEELSELFSSC
ncbi:hypothetical protein V6N13_021637 [Hibiscus sabdariffa]